MDTALDIMFRKARTYHHWTDRPVSDEVLHKIYDLARMGATSANCSPMRVVFVRSPEAKQRLKPCLAEGNVNQSMAAPITAIIAHDMEFYEKLPQLFPHTDARAWFKGNDQLIATTAFRNGTLQAAYLMLAARANGVDCGPMSGFDNAKVDKEFFSGTNFKSNFLCNLGHGDPSHLYPRHPRLNFEEACRIV